MSARPPVMFIAVAGLLAATFASVLAFAAGGKPSVSKKEPAPEPIAVDGIVQSVESKQFVILVESHKKRRKKRSASASRKTYTVIVRRDTKFKITGLANPDYLHPGQMVEFSGDIDMPLFNDTLKELTVMQTSARGNSRKDKAPKGMAAADDFSRLDNPLGEPHVIARLGQPHEDNKWTVHVGNKTTEIQLADDAKIKVVLSDARLMSAGDSVLVQGKTLPGKSNECVADTVMVTLAKPLISKKRPGPPKIGTQPTAAQKAVKADDDAGSGPGG